MKKALKTCWLIICFSIGSHCGQKQPRNAVFALEQRTDGRTDRRTDGRTDGRTDTTSYRDATAHLKKKRKNHERKKNERIDEKPDSRVLRSLEGEEVGPNQENVKLYFFFFFHFLFFLSFSFFFFFISFFFHRMGVEAIGGRRGGQI